MMIIKKDTKVAKPQKVWDKKTIEILKAWESEKPMSAKEFNVALTSVVWKEGKSFVAQCLNVDVSSFGKSRESALKNLDEALELYFDEESVPDFTPVEQPKIVPLVLQHA